MHLNLFLRNSHHHRLKRKRLQRALKKKKKKAFWGKQSKKIKKVLSHNRVAKLDTLIYLQELKFISYFHTHQKLRKQPEGQQLVLSSGLRQLQPQRRGSPHYYYRQQNFTQLNYLDSNVIGYQVGKNDNKEKKKKVKTCDNFVWSLCACNRWTFNFFF